jgi:hypothetical protein
LNHRGHRELLFVLKKVKGKDIRGRRIEALGRDKVIFAGLSENR